MLLSGFHRGWSVDKFIEETERPRVRILTLMDDLESALLVRGRNDFNMRPGLPVLREEDVRKADPLLERNTREFVQIINDHWDEVEAFRSSLEADQEFPEPENLYRILVGGVLLGGMIDALYDEGTLMPGPPRRARRGEGYYAWMVEGAEGHNYLVHQTARVGRHEVFSVGPVAEENLRIQLDDLAAEGPVYETEDARRWRIFTSVFSRDYLIPYLKTQRNDIFDIHSDIEASELQRNWGVRGLVLPVTCRADRRLSGGVRKDGRSSELFSNTLSGNPAASGTGHSLDRSHGQRDGLHVVLHADCAN